MRNYKPTGVPIQLQGVPYPSSREQLSQATLKALLHYDADSGVFTRLNSYNRWKAGDVAGTAKRNGSNVYIYIKVGRFIYTSGRLAWLYVTGSWPLHEVDHWNGNSTDNSWNNLRDVTGEVNVQNQRRAPRGKKYSPLLGAHWDAVSGRWKSSIQVKRKAIHLGTFDNDREAHEAYVQAKRRLHAGCTI